MNLLIKPLLEISHQCCATRQHNVVVQVDLKVRIHLSYRLERKLSDATFTLFELGVLHVDDLRVKHALGGRDSFTVRYFNDLLVGKLIASLFLGQVIVTVVHFGIVVHGNVAHFFLHFADVVIVVISDWHLGLLELLDEPFSDFLTGDVDGLHGVGQRVTFENGHGVGDTLTTFRNQSRSNTIRKQGQNRRILQRKRLETEVLKHDLSQPLLVLCFAHRAVRHEHRRVSRIDVQLNIEDVIEQISYPAPILHNTALNWLMQFEFTATFESFSTELFGRFIDGFGIAWAQCVIDLDVFSLTHHGWDGYYRQVLT